MLLIHPYLSKVQDIRELIFTNFFDCYTDWVDRLSVCNAQDKMQVSENLISDEAWLCGRN